MWQASSLGNAGERSGSHVRLAACVGVAAPDTISIKSRMNSRLFLRLDISEQDLRHACGQLVPLYGAEASLATERCAAAGPQPDPRSCRNCRGRALRL
mmetsp:Transcript_61305/g.175871  ORF Transcript_61305/g.175871 Transcript_61305/m.175871 type:complete len:98 (+) Transcript_61305:388-681(+)